MEKSVKALVQRYLIMLCVSTATTIAAYAQDEPSTSQPQEAQSAQDSVPPVEVIQDQPAPPPPPPAPVATPTPQPSSPSVPVDEVVEAPEELQRRGPGGRPLSSAAPTTSPIFSNSILPANLDGFAGAATNVNVDDIIQFQSRTTNDIISNVPGTHIVNDDGLSRHGGIGIRGAPPRRSRKTLVLENGVPINMSIYIDPSTHYVPPPDRLEGMQVIRGFSILHGPNNNHGIVNFLNLYPFGPDETVIKGTIGTTKNEGRADGPGINLYGINNSRHIHTRKQSKSGNLGAVFSYTGEEADGTWNNERLRYNDFYAALGARNDRHEVVLSGTYFRQRDNYDEGNLEGEEGEDEPGDVERRFFSEIGHCKTCFNPGSVFNTYNGDIWRVQLTHNFFINPNTTLSSRVYSYFHRRDRYQNFEGSDPKDDDVIGGLSPAEEEGEVLVPEGVMLGRLRTYRHLGAETRLELANRPLLGRAKQDIQFGVRIENHDFQNRNFLGEAGEILEDGDKNGLTIFDTDTSADGISFWLQSAMHLTPTLTVTPGLRVEHYQINRRTNVKTEEEGEAEEIEEETDFDFGEGDTEECDEAFGANVDECFEFEGLTRPGMNEKFNRTHVLPGVAFAWTGLLNSTVYGSYHRGLTMHVLREEAFPPGEEIGDNFQIGLRSKAIKGLTFDIAYFHNLIDDFQIKGSTTDLAGNNTFGNADEVEIKGVEIYARLDSKAFRPNPFNLFGIATYTYSDSIIKKGISIVREEDDPDDFEVFNIAGNEVPEVPRHFANLTFGVEHEAGWDASITWQYRGAFFTDELNTPFGGDEEGEDGKVPDIWLVNARANMKLPGTNTSLFISGTNLTDELYITDREDGIKPGQGRTIKGGVKIKFN